jgi:hypothetical protein
MSTRSTVGNESTIDKVKDAFHLNKNHTTTTDTTGTHTTGTHTHATGTHTGTGAGYSGAGSGVTGSGATGTGSSNAGPHNVSLLPLNCSTFRGLFELILFGSFSQTSPISLTPASTQIYTDQETRGLSQVPLVQPSARQGILVRTTLAQLAASQTPQTPAHIT